MIDGDATATPYLRYLTGWDRYLIKIYFETNEVYSNISIFYVIARVLTILSKYIPEILAFLECSIIYLKFEQTMQGAPICLQL